MFFAGFAALGAAFPAWGLRRRPWVVYNGNQTAPKGRNRKEER